jgi:hypothetical protein
VTDNELVNAVADEVIRRLNVAAPEGLIDLPGAVKRAALKSEHRRQCTPEDAARVAQAVVRDHATVVELRNRMFPGLLR